MGRCLEMHRAAGDTTSHAADPECGLFKWCFHNQEQGDNHSTLPCKIAFPPLPMDTKDSINKSRAHIRQSTGLLYTIISP
mmetsp:Transcript_32509/g.52891  ORF Transcript_32509/g.52891 Transcript_32509/m.52891 type:complete len:80 (-) Transcript_32509:32-271(-)